LTLAEAENQEDKLLSLHYKKGGIIMGQFGPKQNPKAVGEQSEAIIIAKLPGVGYRVLTPFGDNRRYDLVIEDADKQFWRVQCKTAWIKNEGALIEFATASSYYHTKAGRTEHGRRDYRGQIDYFAVYSPDTEKVYLVPIGHVEATTSARLRLVQTKNKQEKNVRWAKDYEI
jgi:PD-(D/E)XK endonuclease